MIITGDCLDHIDLFSGIGGFALAARWAGFETVQFVEIDPFCQKVLQKNFPGVPIHDDIKTFTYAEGKRPREEREYRKSSTEWSSGGNSVCGEHQTRPFLLTGGFPCQPFSCAGKRRGKEDDRYLWPEMLRFISEAKPTWIIGENVAGIINMGLDECISDLEREGYEVQSFVIPACAVNAPHRRDRVWIVANSISGGAEQGHADPREPFAVNGGGYRDAPHSTSRETHPTEPGRLHAEPCGTDSDATDPDRFNGDDAGHDAGEISQLQKAEIFRGEFNTDPGNTRLQGSERPGPHGEGPASHGSTTECLSAWNEPWNEPWIEAATRLCRVDDGVPRQVDRVNRLKALGNAIVPQVAFEIMKAIKRIEAARLPLFIV